MIAKTEYRTPHQMKFPVIENFFWKISIFILIFPQHTSTTDAKVCVRNYNSNAKSKDTITVDYMVIGGW